MRTHRALSQHDILHLVLSYLSLDLPTLAVAARVSLAFFEPAADFLYRTQTSLVNVVHVVLSARISHTQRVLEPVAHIRSVPGAQVGDVSEAGWKRFDTYARRIRSLILPPRPAHTPHSIYELLTARAQSHVLFPSLVRLTWTDGCCEAGTPFVLHILQQSLHSLATFEYSYADWWGRPKTKESIEKVLSVRCEASCMRHLAVAGPFRSCIQRLDCPGLQSLWVEDFKVNLDDVLGYSALFPRLEELHVCQLADPEPSDSADTVAAALPPRGAFCHLQSLKIDVGSARAVARLLECTASSRLALLECRSLEVVSCTELIPMLTVVQARCGGMLRVLNLDVLSDAVPPASAPVPFRQLIAPLLSMPALEDMSFSLIPRRWGNTRQRLTLHDADIAEMALAWPRLVRLCLDVKCDHRSRPSVLSLVAFAQHCPRIATIKFFCDGVGDHDVPLPPALGRDAAGRRCVQLHFSTHQGDAFRGTRGVAEALLDAFGDIAVVLEDARDHDMEGPSSVYLLELQRAVHLLEVRRGFRSRPHLRAGYM